VAYCGLWHGATTVLVSEFDAKRVLDILERERVTNAVLLPTMQQMLNAVPGAAERDFSALRSIACGAAPITTLIALARERLAGYKLPRSIQLVDDLPRTPSGKVLKRDLRKRYGN
jgi:acyl-CoA synthetase (AMP-forming)/AMP-acid ligase II